MASIDLPRTGQKLDKQWLINGEVWLHLLNAYGPGRLLRMAPVSNVYHMGVGPEAPDPMCLDADTTSDGGL